MLFWLKNMKKNLASHRYVVGKFLGTAEVLDVENHWLTQLIGRLMVVPKLTHLWEQKNMFDPPPPQGLGWWGRGGERMSSFLNVFNLSCLWGIQVEINV